MNNNDEKTINNIVDKNVRKNVSKNLNKNIHKYGVAYFCFTFFNLLL